MHTTAIHGDLMMSMQQQDPRSWQGQLQCFCAATTEGKVSSMAPISDSLVGHTVSQEGVNTIIIVLQATQFLRKGSIQ